MGVTVTIDKAKEICILLNELKKLLEKNRLGKVGKVLLGKVEEVREILKGEKG